MARSGHYVEVCDHESKNQNNSWAFSLYPRLSKKQGWIFLLRYSLGDTVAEFFHVGIPDEPQEGHSSQAPLYCHSSW